MIIRPRRPVVRSRADHAVTASFSRSMSIWSGTSTAYAGTERAASSASTTIKPQATCGAKPASRVPPATRKTPMPEAIQTFCTSRPEAPAARVAPAAAAAPRPAMPTRSGSRSAPGCQAAAYAAAPANAGAAAARWAAYRPVGTMPLAAASRSSAIVACRWVSSAPAASTPARTPAAAATAHHSAAPSPPLTGRRYGGPRGASAEETGGGGGPKAAISTAPDSTPTVSRPTDSGSSRPAGVSSAGRLRQAAVTRRTRGPRRRSRRRPARAGRARR